MYLLTHIPSHFSAAAVASCGTVWPVWGGRPSLYSTAWSAGSHCSRGPSYRTAETPLQTTGEKQSENREHHNSDPSFESVFGSLFHFYHKFTLLFIKDKLLKFWYLDNTFLINKTPNMSTKILYKQHFKSWIQICF